MVKKILLFMLSIHTLNTYAATSGSISVVSIIADLSTYKDQRMAVVGILGWNFEDEKKSGGSYILYMDRESQENGIVKNSALVTFGDNAPKDLKNYLKNYIGKYVVVYGTITKRTTFDGIYFSGWIKDVDRASLYETPRPDTHFKIVNVNESEPSKKISISSESSSSSSIK